jgi:anaerobic selenocysteine-containing dehydrogenase
MAVAEIFMTPTAAMADIVLPVAHQYEMNDIGHYGIGHGMIFARPKIVEPPEECWPDIKIMTELGKRVSPPDLWPEDHEQFLEDLVRPAGLTYREFVEKGYLKGPEIARSYETKGFPTPTGRWSCASARRRVRPEALPEFSGLPEEDDPEYPLILISAKSQYYLLSAYRWVKRLRDKHPEPTVEIHPDTAVRYDIRDGADVVIETKYGMVTQKALVTDIIHPRVVSASLGWWFPEGDPASQYDWQSANFNMLTSIGKLGKEYGTPNLKNMPCRIRRKA